MPRPAFAFYLASLALLPWSWVPPFPWLHANAQWSDAVFALAAAAWAVEKVAGGGRPRLRPLHWALLAYAGWAAASLLATSPTPERAAKLLGIAELAALAVLTSDFAARPRGPRAIAGVVAATSLATAAAAIAGVALHLAGTPTRLTGTYGDLLPGGYARAQAGFEHPNLLASFAIFAAGIVAREDAHLPAGLRRAASAALHAAVLLTFSRGILAYALAWIIRRRARLVVVAASVAAAVGLVALLTARHLVLDPVRPWEARLADGPSPRLEALTSSLATLAEKPLFGAGTGSLPGRARGQAFDAHLTPLNVAATMGLPALLAFAAIPALLWRGRGRPTDRATWSVLAGLALEAASGDIEDFRHLWVAFGLADAGRERADRVVVSGR